MIQSLCDIRAAKERFPDMPTDQVILLSMICTRISNGATWSDIRNRLQLGKYRWNTNYRDIRLALTVLNADEIMALDTQEEQNWDDFVDQSKRDIEQTKWHKAHPRPICWPLPDPDALVGMTTSIAIQVNGKLRATVEAPYDALQETVEQLALQNERVIAHIYGKQITRKVFVEGRVLNFVVQDGIG